MDQKSVLVTQEYGKVEYFFREVMDAKQINRNQLSKRADIQFQVANRFYLGNIERMDMDVLARVLYVLDCEVGDVMRYSKPE